ncbi:hypothetical protein pb186bvf_005615 [Paramecium bursaria]
MSNQNSNQQFPFTNSINNQMIQSIQPQQIGLQSYNRNQQQQAPQSNNQQYPYQQSLYVQQQQQPVINNITIRNESLQQNNQQKQKIKLLQPSNQQQTRQIEEIMRHFSNDRDQYIEPQFRNYLQKDCNIDELKKEYIPRQYQMLELPEITQELDGYIKVRGDGNCFYNSFIYQYLVLVLQKSPEDYKQWKEKFSQLKFIIKLENSNPFNVDDYKTMSEAFFKLIEEIYFQDSRFRIQQFQEKYSTNWSYLYQLSIIFCRSIISTCLNNMKTFDQDKAEFYDTANQEVSIWEQDCNYNELVLDSVNKLLKIPIKLFIFEKDSFRIMNYESGKDNESWIFIIFRQGHYVIPKVKLIQKSNTSIVNYEQKFQLYQKQIQQQQEQEGIVSFLKSDLDNAQLRVQSYQKQLELANQEIKSLKYNEQGYQNKIRDLENRFQQEIKYKKQIESNQYSQTQLVQSQQSEINKLKTKIKQYEDQLSGLVQQNEIQKEQISQYLIQIQNYKISEKQQQQLKFDNSTKQSGIKPKLDIKQPYKVYQQIGSLNNHQTMEVEKGEEYEQQQIQVKEINILNDIELDKLHYLWGTFNAPKTIDSK